MKNFVAALLFVTATLSGCGEATHQTISGTYADKDGSTLVFEGGKVKVPGIADRETDFTVSGSTLKYKFADGYPVEATLSGDGFTTNYGYVYKKVH
ncbi:hypothetical protein PHO31112_04302 [Pandoraea horticolens]|uniref:Lipoprotein n=1 Tax=Pandoraea horticolens TaxID=2508298 RepID=A0A5E4Y6N1_9BURK|nr:hypothetical protein [Pandoraea horticolens]VVE43985.1 hypothetical protein PHO31112_04302 [Pandoraea horticolens]